jgi:hypothetical protein
MNSKQTRLGRIALGTVLMGSNALGAGTGFGAVNAVGGGCCRNIQSVTTEATGFYCNMGALTSAERARYKVLAEKLKAANAERKEEASGYAFRINTAEASLVDVAEWVNFEKRCCPFFDFEITLQREGGPLWLKVGGRDGVKAFISDEFGFGTRQVQQFEAAAKNGKRD